MKLINGGYTVSINFSVHDQSCRNKLREFLSPKNIKKLKAACDSPDIWEDMSLAIHGDSLGVGICYEGSWHNVHLLIEETNSLELVRRLSALNLDALIIFLWDNNDNRVMELHRSRGYDSWIILSPHCSWKEVGNDSKLSKREFADFCKKVIDGHWSKHDKFGWG